MPESEEVEEIDPLEVVKTQMQELEELTEFKRDVDEVIAHACAEEVRQLKEIDEQIAELQSKREVVQASMQEKAPEAYEDLIRVTSDLEKKEAAIKKTVYSLPVDVVRKGFKVAEGKVLISVSKVSTTVVYSERVLDDHPEFDELYADGDPLVVRRVNSTVLERLVADGTIRDEDVKDYRIETKVRNPSVRIALTSED